MTSFKLFLITTFIGLFFSSSIFGQVIIFSDNFDSYIAGQQAACQNPVDWTTWSNLPCDPTEDAYISSNYAYSGANSVVIAQNNDFVKPLGNVTSGNWHISFMVYIPTGSNGYFNTLIQFNPPTYEWGVEVYFNAGGAGSVNAGGTATGSFTFSYDTWFPVDVFVNLDLDQGELQINNTNVPILGSSTWQWTLGASGTGGSLMLGGNDFFGATATDQMYFDDYTVWDLIVPVELTSFTANLNDLGQVSLNWETATETNNQGFEIERRTESSEFVTIGYVQGSGTTTETRSYSYLDQNVDNGFYYYRLKQIDFDGTYSYSDEVEVDVTGPLTFNLDQNYPNPFNPSTNIKYSVADAGNVRLSVYNLVGEEIAVLVDGFNQAGVYEVTFDASNLPSGTYLYKLQSANSIQTKKMMLLK